ncbi:hypothetical protein WJX82_000459 [Trebouxia sp. C0006]
MSKVVCWSQPATAVQQDSMAFGRKKKTAGPAGTYAGANPRYNGGVVDDGVVEEQSRCCCFKIARVGLMTLTLLTLAIIFGLSVAALVGGYRKYMLYRTDLVEGFRLRTWIGWYQYSQNTFPTNTYAKLKALSVAGYILGLIVAGFLGASALLALFFMLLTCCGRSRSLACIALPFSLNLFGVLVAYYVASAVFYDRHLPISGTHIPWPSWAWCLGIAASLLWLLASIFMLGTPSRTVMKTSKRVYDAEALATVRVAEPIAVTSKPPLGGYSTGGAPQTVAAPEGASLGTVAPVPVNTSKFGRFRKTGKPVASAVVLPSGQHTTVTNTTSVADVETVTAPSYAPNYGGIAPVQTSEVEVAPDNGLGRGAWASKSNVAGGDGTTVV